MAVSGGSTPLERRVNDLRVMLLAAAWLGAMTCGAGAARLTDTEANLVAEIRFTAANAHADPFKGVEVDVVFTDPAGTARTVPAFWAGGDTWKVRYASPLTGTHRYRSKCSAAGDAGLHGVEGQVEVKPYAGQNPLYRHGPVQIAADHRHFAHADGTPFFWLGDTWWKGLCGRIPWEGFQELAADRKGKGFTVVQIVAGPYPDEPPFDPRWANEGGMPYEPDYAMVNPRYFDFADRRIEHLVASGIVPAIVGGWGWHMPAVGVAKFNRHWRYLIARYGAYPVIWIVGGEAGGKEWTEVARFVQKTDPYRHPATFHPYSSGRRAATDESVLNFDMLQTGHGDWTSAANTISKVTASYSKTPTMPVLVGEVGYEGHMMMHREDLQRFMFWACLLSGAAGHTYGAGGIWQMNSETVRGAEYEFTPWFKAMRLPGSGQLGQSKKLLEEYPWWRFEPHPEWVEPHSTALFQPHKDWFDDNKEWAAREGKYDLPYAAGIPGEVRFVFIPGNHPYVWAAPTVKLLESNVTYHAFFYEPVWAKRYELGTLVRPAIGPTFRTEDFAGNNASAWKDYGSPTQRKEGWLVGATNLVTILEEVETQDVLASVDTTTNAEAGIILRFHDVNHYLVGFYTPSLKAIYLHDRKNGAWGDALGKVAVPEIGPSIHLTAAVCGDNAAVMVTDGTRTYTTPGVKVSNTVAGKTGLWCFQVGRRQQFDNFALSRIQLPPVKSAAKGQPLVLNANPGVLPEVRPPETSMLLGDAYCPARLPSPQDWVLVLERVGP